MEHIRQALLKANTTVGERRPEKAAGRPTSLSPEQRIDEAGRVPSWAPPLVHLNRKHLEANRIISAAGDDPTHTAFDILRTRVQKSRQDSMWKSIVVTSPTAGCGKTMVALNLAYSLSRMPKCRTVLLDLDLKKPAVAKTLGVTASGSVGQFLVGKGEAGDCFLKVNESLVVGVNTDRIRHSSELLQSPRMDELLSFVWDHLSPDVLLFDLPPMRGCDDALAFLPQADKALLVIAAGATTGPELDECEHQISQLDKLLGIVMNKCESHTGDYYH